MLWWLLRHIVGLAHSLLMKMICSSSELISIRMSRHAIFVELRADGGGVWLFCVKLEHIVDLTSAFVYRDAAAWCGRGSRWETVAALDHVRVWQKFCIYHHKNGGQSHHCCFTPSCGAWGSELQNRWINWWTNIALTLTSCSFELA